MTYDLTRIDTAAARLPSTYDAAKQAISQCASIDECKDWSDKASALASYARQANDDELEVLAKRIRARALRRYGELREQIEPRQGANQNIGCSAAPKVFTRAEADKAAGMSPDQAKRASAIARIPEDEFEAQVESDDPPTAADLARQGRGSRSQSALDRPSKRKLTPLAEGFRAWNRMSDGERDQFRAWITDDTCGGMVIDEAIERLRRALGQGWIAEEHRGAVSGFLKQAGTGRWYPTPPQVRLMRLILMDLGAPGGDLIDWGE